MTISSVLPIQRIGSSLNWIILLSNCLFLYSGVFSNCFFPSFWWSFLHDHSKNLFWPSPPPQSPRHLPTSTPITGLVVPKVPHIIRLTFFLIQFPNFNFYGTITFLVTFLHSFWKNPRICSTGLETGCKPVLFLSEHRLERVSDEILEQSFYIYLL